MKFNIVSCIAAAIPCYGSYLFDDCAEISPSPAAPFIPAMIEEKTALFYTKHHAEHPKYGEFKSATNEPVCPFNRGYLKTLKEGIFQVCTQYGNNDNTKPSSHKIPVCSLHPYDNDSSPPLIECKFQLIHQLTRDNPFKCADSMTKCSMTGPTAVLPVHSEMPESNTVLPLAKLATNL